MLKTGLLILVLLTCATPSVGWAQDAASCLFTVGAVADPQYSDTAPYNNRSPREVPKRLQAAVESFNRHKVDFVVSLGDFIDWDDIDYSWPPNTTNVVQSVDWTHFNTLDSLWQQIRAPHYHVLGNHEWYVPDRAADGEKPGRVLRRFGFEDKGYHDFTSQGFRFIILDGNDRYMYAYPKGSDAYLDAKAFFEALPADAPQRRKWNGAISGQQLAWLRDQLSDATEKQQRVVICCHYPIHEPAEVHTLLNHAEVRNILDDFSNVVLWLNGHNHNGEYVLVNKGLPNQRHHLNLKGMQNGDNRYYRLLFFPDRIDVFRAEEKTPERVLPFSALRKEHPPETRTKNTCFE